MVQGLAFLSKKSWHVNNLSNQKKVWEQEQAEAAEASKTKELAKQIQQEREQEELDKIAGKKTAMDRGIDWMYQGGTQGDLAKQDAEKKAEEFLLGKEFVGDGAVQGDFDDGDQKQGINNVLSSTAASIMPQARQNLEEDSKPAAAAMPTSAATAAFGEPSVHDRNEGFRLRTEDPMWAVSQQVRQKEKTRDHTKELYERVVGIGGDGDGDSVGDRKRSSRKDKKRHKKKKKKKSSSSSSRRHHDSDDDGSHDEDRRSRKHRSRKRSRSPSRSRSRSRSRSPDRRDHRRQHRRKHSRRDEDRGYDSSRSESDSYDNRRHRHKGDDRRDHSRRRDDDDDRDRRDYDRSRERRHEDRDRKDYNNVQQRSLDEPNAAKKLEGYGLKGASSYASNTNRNLGPDRELLRQKQDAKEQERRRNAELRHSRKRSTDEERKRALQEMQDDARKREERKVHNNQSSYNSKKVDAEEGGDVGNGGGGAVFLNDIAKQTHGIAGNESLSSRVSQNRHTNQRLHDSFL